MYKQVALLLPILALAAGTGVRAGDLLEGRRAGRLQQVRPVPPSRRIGTVQSADVRRGAIARDADRDRRQKPRDAAVESRSGRPQVHRIGSAERRGDRHPPALGRGRRARRRSTRPADASALERRLAARHSPISSSRCRRRSCFQRKARTCRACSCCRSPSIASATCAASSSAPTIRGFITRTSASTPRRRRASSTSRTRRPATTASSCVRRSIPTGISSDGRRARPLRFCRRGSRGRSRREATSSCSCTSCPAENRS